MGTAVLVTTPSGSGSGRRASKWQHKAGQALPLGSTCLLAKQRDNARHRAALARGFAAAEAGVPGAAFTTRRYGEAALKDWARAIRDWRGDRDVFAYFDNDIKSAAPADAEQLTGLLDVSG